MSGQRIPPALEPAMLDEAGKGRTTREIAAWLAREHGVTTSHVTVAKVLGRHRVERTDAAKAVVREKLAGTLTSDLDRLEEIRASVAAKVATLAPDDVHGFAKLTDLEVKVIDRKLHYSGADEPDAAPAIVLRWPDAPVVEPDAAPDDGEG